MRQALLRLETNHPAWTFFLLCLGIAWPFVILHALTLTGNLGLHSSVSQGLLIGFAQFSPSLAAVLLVLNRHGLSGLRRFLKRIIQVPKHPPWLLVAILLPLFTVATSIGIILLTPLAEPDFQSVSLVLVLPYYLVSLILGLLFGGLSEELGWRGYLLPVLQLKHSALVAGIIVGLFWGVWHLDAETMLVPLFNEGVGAFLSATVSGYGIRLISDVATAILMVWLFNETAGSLLPAILFHSSINAAQTAAVAMWTDFPFAGELIYYGLKWLIVLVLIALLGWQSLSKNRTKYVATDINVTKLEPVQILV